MASESGASQTMMAGRSAARLRFGGAWQAALLAMAALSPGVWAAGDPLPLTLEQAGSRRPPAFTPAYEGQEVAVTGQVSWHPIRLLDYVHLAIQEQGHGLVLEGSGTQFDSLKPGDHVRAEGRISKRGGLPVLIPSRIEVLSHDAAPQPLALRPEQAQGFRYIGLLVAIQGRVVESGENAGGAYLLVGPQRKPLKVFLPFPPGGIHRPFEPSAGDTVAVTGIASQYCPLPPHNSRFQILVRSPADVVRMDTSWLVEPWQFGAALFALGTALLLWWKHERRSRAQRAVMRSMYALGEEVLGASSASEVLRKVSAVAPAALGVTRARLYVYNRTAKTLDRVAASEEEAGSAVALDSPSGVVECAAVACFRNRALLAVPDTRNNPFSGPAPEAGAPRSLLLAPLLAQGEVEGVLGLEDDLRVREFSSNETALVQHLGNQIGLALKLLAQRSMREQLFRSEKLAALGQLISGVVNELRAPLAAIASQAEAALAEAPGAGIQRELRAIVAEAGRASEIVSRLVSFARADRAEAKPVEIKQLLRALIQFREREWKARGIQVSDLLGNGPILVTGSRGQLEQVFLNLIVHAEQALAEVAEKRITIGAKVLAGRVLVEIGCNATLGPEEPDPLASEAGGSGLAVCRGIVTAHGGDIRFERAPAGGFVFQVDLPARSREHRPVLVRQGGRPVSRKITVLSIEPDENAQRHLLEMLGARGYRVVPVRSPAEGLDLVERLRFEIVFCAVQAPGQDSLDVLRKIEEHSGALVMVSENRHLRPPGEAGFLLVKPVEEEQLEEVLESIEAITATAPAPDGR